MDEDTKETFSDKLNLLFLDLRSLKHQRFEECKNQLERWAFIIKNIESMKEKPKEYPTFDELFEAADISHLANDEVISYSQSRMKLEDDRLGMEYYGAQQREEGIKEGEKNMLRNIVLKLRECGMTMQDIADKLGYSDSFIASL